MFAIQIVLEERIAPLLLLARRVIWGYPFRRIPLTQGKFARVDPEDYEALARHKWCASQQSNTFYAVRADGKRQLRMHRVIMKAPKGLVVDHIDHRGWNNTKRNLRLCTRAQNARNQRPRRGGSCKYIGVAYHKGDDKYHARVQDHGKQRFVGAFKSPRAAAKARDDAAIALHGPFAHLNFPRRHKNRRTPRKATEYTEATENRI